MISRLTGKISQLADNYLVLDVNGVGYKIFTTGQNMTKVKSGGPATFWTYLAVRENALDLYGFENEEDLGFFELLITVSGIGPKTALNILNVASVAELRSAVLSENSSHLIKVSGLSKKTADKIVLELRGKLEGEVGSTEGMHDDSDALEALTSLGYSQREARDALQEVSQETEGTSQRVKEALKVLSGK